MSLYVLVGMDNGRVVFRGRTDAPRCPQCGALTDKWNERVMVLADAVSVGLDFSVTQDGVKVVSSRFKATYSNAKLFGLVFVDLGGGFSALVPSRRVGFDSVARRTRFLDPCTLCGRPYSVAGATPAFLVSPVQVDPSEFVWTDLEFGSGDEKGPLLICGESARAMLIRANLKGLDSFSEVRGAG